MSARFTIPQSISKTAIDSLHAKLSAIDAGWLSSSGDNDDLNILNGYANILKQINDGIDGPQSRRRRQTPLVNAGYAARMAVMTFTLEKWINACVESQNHEEEEGINVISLGCGLDALGLWSKDILNGVNRRHGGKNTSTSSNVYEVDSFDNCMLKQHALLKSGILQGKNKDNDNVGHEPFCTVIEGSITDSTKNNDQTDYHLIAMDFKDIRKDNLLLNKALESTGFDATKPTIILSELVLAYVGYESSNAILQSISRDLLRNEYSMFTCLEPILPTGDEQLRDMKLLSVKESYARDYANQFLGKLRRGTSNSRSADDDAFHPLGSNRQKITSRFIFCGFSMANVDATSLRKAVKEVARTRILSAKEPFDEHAALALNLECYAIACAHAAPFDGVRCKLPWMALSLQEVSSKIEIAAIADSSQDQHVGELYGRVYTHFYQKYPAIHKMVKSALKSDLFADSTDDSSSIQYRFEGNGGKFWIAHDVESSKIVGCIGIRQRISRDDDRKDDRGKQSNVIEYEVQRLAVDEKHRGKGIGKRLLNAVCEYSLQRSAVVASNLNVKDKPQKRVLVKLWAVTPAILVSANSLYNAFGFIKQDSFKGGLEMNVYCNHLYTHRI